jgi:hypothetical protein
MLIFKGAIPLGNPAKPTNTYYPVLQWQQEIVGVQIGI